jgi:hypothetical protein
MPVKWKIFFALNFILALPAFVCLALLIIYFSDAYHTGEDNFYFIIFVFALSVITLNGFLNIYLLQRFFPDKLIPAATKRLNLVSLILTSIITAGLLILFIYGASEEFSADNEYRDASGKIALVIILLALIIQTIVLIMQGQLPGRISRNNSEQIDSLVDSIGK